VSAPRSALRAADERKRPRQSNFGSLSGGLIERGKVPDEVLYGPDGDSPERSAAPVSESTIAATADFAPAGPMEPFEARVIRPAVPDDKADAERQAAEERTRPLETTFGSLTEDLLERGKLPRHILTKEQVELLLTPQKVAPEVLRQVSDAVERREDDGLAHSPPVDDAEAELTTVEPEVNREWVESPLSLDPLAADHGASVETEDRAVADVADDVSAPGTTGLRSDWTNRRLPGLSPEAKRSIANRRPTRCLPAI